MNHVELGLNSYDAPLLVSNGEEPGQTSRRKKRAFIRVVFGRMEFHKR